MSQQEVHLFLSYQVFQIAHLNFFQKNFSKLGFRNPLILSSPYLYRSRWKIYHLYILTTTMAEQFSGQENRFLFYPLINTHMSEQA